ncbi:MAG: c-type cytochrome [Pseudomonadota bacterium]|nr:c-type cytochrome [Pseudomonadota bacterium]
MSAQSDKQDAMPTIKNAVAIFAASIGLVLIIFMLAQFAIGAYSGRARPDDPALSAAAIAERLKPVGEVNVDALAPAQVATAVVAAAVPATGTPAAGGADLGKSTYDAVCAACHTAGIAGAPKTGDKAGWSARLGQAKETLYSSALKGKGVMPAKGGNPGLADDAVKAAVDYLISQVR